MDHASDHLSRGLIPRDPSHPLRRFVSVLTLLAGLATSLLTMSQPLALAHTLAPVGQATQNSLCHLSGNSRLEGSITRFDVFQGLQNPIGTVKAQLFYCNNVGTTYYQSAFARFTYTARSIPLPGLAASSIEGTCSLNSSAPMDNTSVQSASAPQCVLQNKQPVDTQITPLGSRLNWYAQWTFQNNSQFQCAEDDGPGKALLLASTCVTKNSTFTSDTLAGDPFIPCDTYPLLDPIINMSMATSNTVSYYDNAANNNATVMVEVIGYYDSEGQYCHYLSTKATIYVPPSASNGTVASYIECVGNICPDYQAQADQTFPYPNGGQKGYTTSYYSTPINTPSGYACAALNAKTCDASTMTV